MIKLQDFATQMGVTDRAIQKHLKTYADELEGLYQRKGPNGTWLTDEACEILRSKMRQAPAAIVEPDERVGELTDRIRDLEGKLQDAEKLIAMAQQATMQAQNRVAELEGRLGNVKLLEETNAAQEARIASLSDEKKKAVETAQVESTRADKEKNRADEAETRADELQEQLDTEKRAREAAETREQALKKRNWWERLTKKGE